MEHRIIVENGRVPNSYIFHIGDGYYYHLKRVSSHSLSFRCQHMRTCHGRAVFNLNNFFQHTQPHNHAPDVLRSQFLAARGAIMDQARSRTYMSFSEILRTEKRRIRNHAVRSRLTLRGLRSSMQRVRGSVYPHIPQSLIELSHILEDPAWETLTRTLDSQDSIYLGTALATDLSVHLVFISSRCLELLRTAVTLFADGTFFITPSIESCYQVFTIVTVHGHTVIPLCWCLMQNKSQDAYESVLTLIRTHLQHWIFTKVVCDFEDAMINAFRIVFGVDTQGCYFHAVDAMVLNGKRIIGLEFIQYYQEVEIVLRVCCTLPLLPAQLLQRGLNAIGVAAMNLGEYLYEIVRPFLAYVQESWMDHPNRGRVLSVCGSDHRTNNANESNNRRMRRKFGVHHPNVYHFLGTVCLFEAETIDDLASLRIGLIPTRHRSVSALCNDILIRRITTDLLRDPDPSDQTLVNFLLAASISIQRLLTEALQ